MLKDNNGTGPAGSVDPGLQSIIKFEYILFNLVMFPSNKVNSGYLPWQHTLDEPCILLDAGHDVFGVSGVLRGPMHQCDLFFN